jgi:hypothetical protein
MIIVKVMKFLDSEEIIDTPNILAIRYLPQNNKYDK